MNLRQTLSGLATRLGAAKKEEPDAREWRSFMASHEKAQKVMVYLLIKIREDIQEIRKQGENK